MRIEYLNLNEDPKCDPEIRGISLSRDKDKMPPSYCLPWVEATHRIVQLKSNYDYLIEKKAGNIQAHIEIDGKKIDCQEMYLKVPPGFAYFAQGAKEEKERVIKSAATPAFSSPWQRETAHSITLKLGIAWWTPPGWGLFFSGPIHRSSDFRIEEGYVRTDLWHRDIPIVVQPLKEEVRIAKYSVVATALLVSAEEIDLKKVENVEERIKEVIHQCSMKRMSQHVYKAMVKGEKGKQGKLEPKE